jgi:redox-sensitive bicupin YhaK (pirin superfamily)
MPRELRDVGASVRARLLVRARAERSDFQILLTRYALERLLYRLAKIQATFEHELEAGANAFLLVLEGSAIVGRQERPVASGELAWLTRSDEAPSLVTIKASGGATHLLLFAGRALREPVVFGGPFVMNTQEQIDEAFADFRAGRF